MTRDDLELYAAGRWAEHYEEVEKAAKLASQWPKPHTHSGGGGFELLSEDAWKKLEHYGYQEDAYGRYELRNCRCGSTLLCLIEVKNLEAE